MNKASSRSLLVLVVLVLAAGGASQWWHAQREAKVAAQVASLAGAGDIHLLSSETCKYCNEARHWLREHRVTYSECFIERDEQCRVAYVASGARGTPTVLVRGRAQLGFKPERVLDGLTQRS